MSLKTHSKFYYGFEVTSTTFYLDFSEGAAELTAELNVAKYTLTEFAVEISRALNAAGGQAYAVAVDRAQRFITISAPGEFELLVETGSHASQSIYDAMGFTGADRTGEVAYTGNVAPGREYKTQFIAQAFVASQDQTGPTFGVVNKAASGRVEAVIFGTESLIDLNLKYVNDYDNGEFGPIRTNPTGVAALRDFLTYAITKGPFEFMADESTPESFETVILESTTASKEGLKFKLDEMYEQGLPGYYETGLMKLRVVE